MCQNLLIIGIEPTTFALQVRRSTTKLNEHNLIIVGPTEIRTRVTGIKIQCDNHYTMGPQYMIFSNTKLIYVRNYYHSNE